MLHGTVEDFHNPEGTNHYLLRYLENAGARTFTARERDWNPDMALSDNDGEGYAESGDGFVDGPAGFADGAPYALDDAPFELGTTRAQRTGGRATWVSGHGRLLRGLRLRGRPTTPGRPPDHPPRRRHRPLADRPRLHRQYRAPVAACGGRQPPGGAHRRRGGGRRWLSPTPSASAAGWTTSSATGRSRPPLGSSAKHYAQFLGAPPSVYNSDGDGGSDPSARSRWAKWEHPSGEDAVYLSWHSNAGGGRGTSTYVYEGAYTRTEGSLELGNHVQDELITSIRTLWDSDWTDRGVRTAAFSEVSPAYNDEMPSALVELAFHDSEIDAEYLKDPRFRRDAARAMYRGIVRSFAERDGVTPAFLPEPPVTSPCCWTGGSSCRGRPAPLEAVGDDAASFVVYRSADGRSWDTGTNVGDVASVSLDADLGEVVYAGWRRSTRAASASPARSSAPAARRRGWPRCSSSWASTAWAPTCSGAAGPIGDVRRFDQHRVNNFDHVAAHGAAVAAAGWFFESAADERLSGLDLPARSRVLFWNAGEESTEDVTFSAEHQTLVRDFVAAGGALWVTGSEVLWDLDFRGSDADRAFAAEVLGAAMESDDAETYSAQGVAVLEGLFLDFGPSDGAPYPAEWPDVLASDDAVIATRGTGGRRPWASAARCSDALRCIGDLLSRAAVAAALLRAGAGLHAAGGARRAG